MPKDVSRPAATRQTHARRRPSALPPPNAPAIKRRLPDSVLDRLERRRAEGRPVKWTDRKVKAVIKHVSTLPPRPASLPVGPSNWARLEAATESASRFERRFKEERSAEAARAQRDQAAQIAANPHSGRPLADRISAAPTYEPIARRQIGIDIPKYTHAELVGIYRPKFEATLLRLHALEEIEFADDINPTAVHRLIRTLRTLNSKLAEFAPYTTFVEWRRFEQGLSSIKDISFSGLRRNLRRVVKDLELVERSSYFDCAWAK